MFNSHLLFSSSFLLNIFNITPTQYCITQVQGICRNYSTPSPASLHTQNVLSKFNLYFNDYTGFRSITISTTRWRYGRIKYGQREIMHTYFNQSYSDYAPTRNLRSTSQYLLNVPAVRTQIARRAFSRAALTVWNDRSACWHSPIWVIRPF